ncbi:hypothetical protein Pelo_16456 [Pelomyxa schiedti]|nr:hypothetical protein Pelo_16456 [Pelomyxa schiedti]
MSTNTRGVGRRTVCDALTLLNADCPSLAHCKDSNFPTPRHNSKNYADNTSIQRTVVEVEKAYNPPSHGHRAIQQSLSNQDVNECMKLQNFAVVQNFCWVTLRLSWETLDHESSQKERLRGTGFFLKEGKGYHKILHSSNSGRASPCEKHHRRILMAPLFHPSLETHSVGISKMHSCAVPFHATQATYSISEARLISELLSLCGASDAKGYLPVPFRTSTPSKLIPPGRTTPFTCLRLLTEGRGRPIFSFDGGSLSAYCIKNLTPIDHLCCIPDVSSVFPLQGPTLVLQIQHSK